MTATSKLESSIKEYTDVYGTILLGMHQDLQAQQETVDRKLAAWGKDAEAALKALTKARLAFAESSTQWAKDMGALREQFATERAALAQDRKAATEELLAGLAGVALAVDDLKARHVNVSQALMQHLVAFEASAKEFLEQSRGETRAALQALSEAQQANADKAASQAILTHRLLYGVLGALVGLAGLMAYLS